jgi:hypothetical protein
MTNKKDLKKASEKGINKLLILGVLVLLITVIIIGILVRTGPIYK